MGIQSKIQPASVRRSPRRSRRPDATFQVSLVGLPVRVPRFVEPMKARLVTELPVDSGWSFELKLDGFRIIAVRNAGELSLFSRRPRDLTAEFPAIVSELKRLPARRWVLDGELVALDERGHSSFQRLQNRADDASGVGALYLYVFDIINLDGHDVTNLPLVTRQTLLRAFLRKACDPVRLCEPLEAAAPRIWDEITRQGLEGLIAKRRNSVYEMGRRSGAWIKIKAHREQEFVIGGYTPPEGSRRYFGSLLVGYYRDGRLLYASGVGTGFDFATLKRLYERFEQCRADKCPFANLPTKRAGRFGQGITASRMRECTWLRPELVCQVRFMEWTQDGNLRQPVFLGLRTDKLATEVVREELSA